MRLDVFLYTNGYCESRNKAAALISSENVKVNGVVITKSSFDVSCDASVEVNQNIVQYVARSAKKLLTAIDVFKIDFYDKIALDLGSSTGGFCEVMLNAGVRRVYAVDIGTNQLHDSLRNNEKIVVMENTNARYLTEDCFDEKINVVTCDLSFISVKHILNVVYNLLSDNGEFICLVKPQFEVGPRFVGKNGVVKDKRAQVMAVNDIVNFASEIGFSVYDISFSGLEGESGNREFLLYLKKDNINFKLAPYKISDTILGRK